MAPDAEDCEAGVPDGEKKGRQSRRVAPEEQLPSLAWTENDDNSPGENKRLLPAKQSRLQAGVTLIVQPTEKHTKCPQFEKKAKIPRTVLEKTKNVFTITAKKQKCLRLLRPPYFLVAITFVLVCIHFWLPQALHEKVEKLFIWAPTHWRSEPWRLVTYGFLHGDNMHLATNVIVGLSVGWVLEREQSWWRVMILWFAGVVSGALGAGVLQHNNEVVGASAGVYAVVTSHVSNVCLRYGHIELWWFRILTVVVLCFSEVGYRLAELPPPFGSNAPVAWSSHIFGVVVGVLCGFLAFTGENTSKRSIIACRVVSAIGLVVGTLWFVYEYSGPCYHVLEQR